MFVIGVTGPSGAGKGEISRLLSLYGARIIDADKVYHFIIAPPSTCLDELVKCFGEIILNENGSLNRKALSNIVFADSNREKLKTLNKITHRYVVDEIRREISELRQSSTQVCVIDAPLLIEADLCGDCDMTIAVLADKETRWRRIALRDSITCDAAMARINSQKDDQFYIANTNYTIYNDAGVEELKEKLDDILRERNICFI